MTTLEMLTMRTNAALARLASLQQRANRLTTSANGVVRPALKELTDALEELRVANAELESRVVELMETREKSSAARRCFDEFMDVMPVACVWTDPGGEIVEANAAAATLLNVSRQHLGGRSFMLFLTNRSAILDALRDLAAGTIGMVDLDAEVRPRERRGRAVRVTGRRLECDNRLCWFLVESRPLDKTTQPLSVLAD